MVYWTELNTWEPEKAASFLETTLGWTLESYAMPDGSTYRTGMVDGAPAGGVFALTEPTFDRSTPAHWVSYFAVEDADASAKALQAAGGQLLRDPFDVAGVGRIVMLTEPTGAVCGFIQPAM